MLRSLLNIIHPPPLDAATIIAGSIERGDYRTAALFLLAGSAEVLSEAEPVTADASERERILLGALVQVRS